MPADLVASVARSNSRTEKSSGNGASAPRGPSPDALSRRRTAVDAAGWLDTVTS